jgi:hypothetical protein
MIMRTISDCWLLLMITCVVTFGCVPVQMGERDLVGLWRVVLQCSTERLDLRPDRTYTQHIAYADGGVATHHGTWRVVPREVVP